MTPTPSRRRWFQFGILEMFAGVTVLAVWLNWELKVMPPAVQLAFVLLAMAGAGAFALASAIPFWIRRKQFRRRNECQFRVWHDRHYAGSGVSSEVAFVVVDALAAEIGCSPTQLLPTDEIDGNLSHAMSHTDPFELADMILEDSLRRMGVPWPLDDSHCRTIDDVVRTADAAFKALPHATTILEKGSSARSKVTKPM